MCALAAAPGAASVRVWAIMSRGGGPRGGRAVPEGVHVDYSPVSSTGRSTFRLFFCSDVIRRIVPWRATILLSASWEAAMPGFGFWPGVVALACAPDLEAPRKKRIPTACPCPASAQAHQWVVPCRRRRERLR